jgi:mRNA-degrading endonuclease RelE of RelBE toxin-antitoxin system
MDKISKVLTKLDVKERAIVKNILEKITGNDWLGLDIKKLKDRVDIFRVRKGKLRIIYRLDKDKNVFILTIERRSDNTYN